MACEHALDEASPLVEPPSRSGGAPSRRVLVRGALALAVVGASCGLAARSSRAAGALSAGEAAGDLAAAPSTQQLESSAAASPAQQQLESPQQQVAKDEDEKAQQTRHVVFVYVDDQGWNDQGEHSTDLSWATPTINDLGRDGITLNRHYGMHLCTPSRASLMTGKLPTNTGMSHSLITGNAPWGLPLEHTLLPEVLKGCDSTTRAHMIGKWHLGHFAHAYTPLHRGFDTFYGFYSGFEDYFVHVAEMSECLVEADCFYDLRDGTTPIKEKGTYSVELFNKRAAQIVSEHSPEVPLFLYYAIPLVHAPMEAPVDIWRRHHESLEKIPNNERRTFAAQTILLDESIAALNTALKTHGLYDDTLLVIAADNGGCPTADGAGSNWPLRGMKGYYWDGGIRTHALIHSPLIAEAARGRTYDGLFSVTDWMPTIVGGFLDRPHALPVQLDGMDLWGALTDVTLSREHGRRSEMLVNIDVQTDMETGGRVHTAAYFDGDLKILINVQMQPRWPVPHNDTPEEGGPHGLWDWLAAPYNDYLFNITDDPTESRDLKAASGYYKGEYERMKRRVSELKAEMAPTAYCAATNDMRADAIFNLTNFITPWMSADFVCLDNRTASAWEADYCAYGLLPAWKCTATEAPTAEPTRRPFPGPTAEPTHEPTRRPLPYPTTEPTNRPLPSPTADPTEPPVPSPTAAVVSHPIPAPTSAAKTVSPVPAPTAAKTASPVPAPTAAQTANPVPAPTAAKTASPVPAPTAAKTASPVPAPTAAAVVSHPLPVPTAAAEVASPVPAPTVGVGSATGHPVPAPTTADADADTVTSGSGDAGEGEGDDSATVVTTGDSTDDVGVGVSSSSHASAARSHGSVNSSSTKAHTKANTKTRQSHDSGSSS